MFYSAIVRSVIRGFIKMFGGLVYDIDGLFDRRYVDEYLSDFHKVSRGAKSVAKGNIKGRRAWEIYRSSNSNIYVYFPQSGKRVIHSSK